MRKRGSALLVALIVAAGLLVSQPVSAKSPRPEQPAYGFVFDGDATHTFHEHAVNESGCTGDIAQNNTASWRTTWGLVELPALGHKRTHYGKSRTFTGENHYTDDVPACGGAPPTSYECTGTSASNGTRVAITITADRRDPTKFSVAIRAVGGVKDKPSSCPGPPWASVLRKTFSLTAAGLPRYHQTEDLRHSSSVNCLPGATAGSQAMHKQARLERHRRDRAALTRAATERGPVGAR